MDLILNLDIAYFAHDMSAALFYIAFSINPSFPPPFSPTFPQVPYDEGKMEYNILSHYCAIVGKMAPHLPYGCWSLGDITRATSSDI